MTSLSETTGSGGEGGPSGESPVIVRLDPDHGQAGEGETVQIHGHNLAAVFEVIFGDNILTKNDFDVDLERGTSVTVNRTPPGTAGSNVPVRVRSRDAGGHIADSNTLWYVYDTPSQ